MYLFMIPVGFVFGDTWGMKEKELVQQYGCNGAIGYCSFLLVELYFIYQLAENDNFLCFMFKALKLIQEKSVAQQK